LRFDARFHLRRDKMEILDRRRPATDDIANFDIRQTPDFTKLAGPHLGALDTFAQAKTVELFHFMALRADCIPVGFSVYRHLSSDLERTRKEPEIGNLFAGSFAFDLNTTA
jgi:hypothetical protein